jgi:hypothetical protein
MVTMVPQVGSGVHSLAETRAWEASADPEERRMVGSAQQ